MNRRKLLQLSVIGTLVVGAAVGVPMLRPQSDCEVARNMTDYNLTAQKVLAAGNDLDTGRQTPIEDYRKWVDRLADYSGRISDPNLSVHARGMVDDADKVVDLLERERNMNADAANPEGLPGGIIRLGGEFHAHRKALDAACPAS